MTYSIQIKASAAKDLARISKPDRRRIAAAIDLLAEQPHRGSLLKVNCGDCAGFESSITAWYMKYWIPNLSF